LAAISVSAGCCAADIIELRWITTLTHWACETRARGVATQLGCATPCAIRLELRGFQLHSCCAITIERLTFRCRNLTRLTTCRRHQATRRGRARARIAREAPRLWSEAHRGGANEASTGEQWCWCCCGARICWCCCGARIWSCSGLLRPQSSENKLAESAGGHRCNRPWRLATKG
jgi:hypothetical protein